MCNDLKEKESNTECEQREPLGFSLNPDSLDNGFSFYRDKPYWSDVLMLLSPDCDEMKQKEMIDSLKNHLEIARKELPKYYYDNAIDTLPLFLECSGDYNASMFLIVSRRREELASSKVILLISSNRNPEEVMSLRINFDPNNMAENPSKIRGMIYWYVPNGGKRCLPINKLYSSAPEELFKGLQENREGKPKLFLYNGIRNILEKKLVF